MSINNDKHKPESEHEKDKPEREKNKNNSDTIGGWKLSRGWNQAHDSMKKSMETKYAKEWGSNKCGSTAKSKITDKKTKYLRLGYTQNPRKIEMAKCGAATTKKRGPINPTK